VIVTVTENILPLECTYVLVRTYTATDNCGNSSVLSNSITVVDETAPVFSETPASLVLACADEVPAIPVIVAIDACEGEVDVTFTEVIATLPVDDSALADCSMLTPDVSNFQWALWLHNFPSAYLLYYATDVQFVEFADGTAHLTGTLVSSTNPNAGWVANVWFQDGMNWADWSTQSFLTSYKDDSGFGVDHYMDWTYYILNSTSATLAGTGDLMGSMLNLEHAPSNYYYGFQLGIAANGMNAEHGLGGWIHYSGIHMNAALEGYEDGLDVSGGGDFAFDGICCEPYSIVRTWTAEDCSGNSTTHTQTIVFGGAAIETPPAVAPRPMPTDFNGHSVALSSVYPNPTSGLSKIEFMAALDTRVVLGLYDVLGNEVIRLFEGEIYSNAPNSIVVNSADLQNGVYMIRIKSNKEVVAQRLVIQK